MPKRLTPETWLHDEAVNALNPLAELFFRRLWTLADDYGNFYGSADTLRGRVFPMHTADHTAQDVTGYLAECTAAGLLSLYEVSGSKYIHLHNYGQQIKSRPKFPLPPLPEQEARQLTPDPARPTLHNVTVLLARSAAGLTPPQVQDCAARYLQTDIPADAWQADCLTFAAAYSARVNRPTIV